MKIGDTIRLNALPKDNTTRTIVGFLSDGDVLYEYRRAWHHKQEEVLVGRLSKNEITVITKMKSYVLVYRDGSGKILSNKTDAERLQNNSVFLTRLVEIETEWSE